MNRSGSMFKDHSDPGVLKESIKHRLGRDSLVLEMRYDSNDLGTVIQKEGVFYKEEKTWEIKS